MHISPLHEWVLVAAFQYGGDGADPINVARDLALDITRVTDLVSSLYHAGYLDNEGSGGAIIFANHMREDIRQIEEKYLADANALLPDEKKVLTTLAPFGQMPGDALASGTGLSRDQIHGILGTLTSKQLVEYRCVGATPNISAVFKTEITSKGRLFAILLTRTPEPMSANFEVSEKPRASELMTIIDEPDTCLGSGVVEQIKRVYANKVTNNAHLVAPIEEGQSPLCLPSHEQMEQISAERETEEQDKFERLLVACYETKGSPFNLGEAARLAGLSEGEAQPFWMKLHQRQLIRLRENYMANKTTEGAKVGAELKKRKVSSKTPEGEPNGTSPIEHVRDAEWLWGVVKESARALPVNILVVGLVGLGAGAALIRLFFFGNVLLAVAALFGMLILMAVLLLLSWAKEHAKKDARPLYLFFLTFALAVFVVVTALMISVTFFGVPVAGAKRIFGG